MTPPTPPKPKRSSRATGRPTGRPPKSKAQKDADKAAATKARRERRRALKAVAAKAREEVKARAAADAAALATTSQKSEPGGQPFKPTDEDRQRVQTLAGLGLRHDEIALMVLWPNGVPIDEKTLQAHFARELAVGPVLANSQVAQAVLKKALGNGPQSGTLAIWWTKTRMGWKEQVGVEVELKSGVLVAPARESADEWIDRVGQQVAAAVAENTGGGS